MTDIPAAVPGPGPWLCAHCSQPITGSAIREWNGPAGNPTRQWHADRPDCRAAAVPAHRPAPAERCGDLKPSIIDKQRTECVLRPGHNGSHADEHGTRWRMLPDAPDVDLREQIVDALRTTPATGHTHKPGEEKWDHHPKPGEQGHNYTYTCALCRGDIHALADAMEAVFTGHMVRVTGALRAKTQRLEQRTAELEADLEAWLERLRAKRADARPEPEAPDAGLREQYAEAIWAAGRTVDYNALDAVLSVRDRRMEQLRAKVEALEAGYDQVAADATKHGLCHMKQGALIQRAEQAEAALPGIHALHGKHHRAIADALQAPHDTDWAGLAERAEQAAAALTRIREYAALLREYLALADITHRYPIQGGHDSLGAGLTCAGYALRDRIRTALGGTRCADRGERPVNAADMAGAIIPGALVLAALTLAAGLLVYYIRNRKERPVTNPVDPMSIVYRERHHLVAHLAAAYPSILVYRADPDAPDWPVLFVTLPTGQVSWHINPADLDLFAHVTVGTGTWDDHTTEEKYKRLDAHTRMLAAATEE